MKIIRNTINRVKAFCSRKYHQAEDSTNSAVLAVRNAVNNTVAEGYVDTGVKILIAVVIGALLLAGLYALFNTTIMPTVSKKITDLFSYNGH